MGSLFKKAEEVGKESVVLKEPEITEKEAEAIVGSVALVIEEEAPVDEFAVSAAKLEDARAGRNYSDIPMGDPYWIFLSDHNLAHGTHTLRTDELDTVKGKPVKK